jgi:branched-chain amino acid transport system ATP-binding protein
VALLELENVEASYGAVRAVRGISLAVEEGAIVALLGANGAGKSTTLKAICGAVRPNAGRILLDRKPISGLSPNQIVKQGVALVPEGRKIFKDLTVQENLAMGAYSRGDKAGIEADYRIVFELFPRLEERKRQLGGSLSGGEQQMLAIGRGLMARPRLLLLDEPSLGLAPIIISNIFEALRRINREQARFAGCAFRRAREIKRATGEVARLMCRSRTHVRPGRAPGRAGREPDFAHGTSISQHLGRKQQCNIVEVLHAHWERLRLPRYRRSPLHRTDRASPTRRS